jgi:hypothetical protein
VNLWTCREDIVSSIRSRCTNTMCMHRLLMLPLKGSRGRVVCVGSLSVSDTRTFAVCERYLDKQPDAMLIRASFGMRWIALYCYVVQSPTAAIIHLPIYVYTYSTY